MVLLVEDEPMITKVVGELLDEAGYWHVTIADHNEIPSAVARWHPQCVILDSELAALRRDGSVMRRTPPSATLPQSPAA